MKVQTSRSRRKTIILFLASILLFGLPASAKHNWFKTKHPNAAQAASGQGMQMLEGRVMGMSKHNFDDTVSKIKDAIGAQNMMVLFTADHQQMLSMVGLKTPPMETIEFFSPSYGKVIFQTDSRGALEVPFRIAIMQNDQGQVMFAYDKPSYLFARYPKLADLGQQLDAVMDQIVAGVRAPMKM